ncbi:MAG: alpha/beta hydrolase [Christensenellaceae bacterium]|nr:alpha/beta hydrolase [Christensenellaceae bacterium]MDY2851639.1 alpha/beta hydrolase [Christensenellaceae bacterium]
MESGPKELSSITVPTLVICGTKDMIRNDHTKLIACSIPGAVLKIIKWDHFIANKQAEEFNRAVAEFLETI